MATTDTTDRRSPAPAARRDHHQEVMAAIDAWREDMWRRVAELQDLYAQCRALAAAREAREAEAALEAAREAEKSA